MYSVMRLHRICLWRRALDVRVRVLLAAIRAAFPRYAVLQDRQPPKVSVVNGNTQVTNQPAIPNHNFVSADNKWKLNLTRNFISLSTLAYTTWEEFGQNLDRPLAQFLKLYQPAFL